MNEPHDAYEKVYQLMERLGQVPRTVDRKRTRRECIRACMKRIFNGCAFSGACCCIITLIVWGATKKHITFNFFIYCAEALFFCFLTVACLIAHFTAIRLVFGTETDHILAEGLEDDKRDLREQEDLNQLRCDYAQLKKCKQIIAEHNFSPTKSLTLTNQICLILITYGHKIKTGTYTINMSQIVEHLQNFSEKQVNAIFNSIEDLTKENFLKEVLFEIMSPHFGIYHVCNHASLIYNTCTLEEAKELNDDYAIALKLYYKIAKIYY